MKRIRPWLLLLGAAYWCSACDDPLKPVERVEDLRVLGARVEVEGDPDRAAPAPGEGATVRWLVASPDAAPSIGWALAACVAVRTNIGTATCDGSPFATATSTAPAFGAPTLTLQVPADVDPSASPRIAVLGSVCGGEQPIGDAENSRCPSGVSGTKVSLEFELARQGDTNTNPRFGDPAMELEGTPWLAVTPEAENCESGALPRVGAGTGAHTIGVSVAPDARDSLPQEDPSDPAREDLLVSHFSTAGELDHAFSTITSEAASTAITVPWSAPKTAPDDGLVVRFWFVVRDFRGGSEFTERALCVVP